MDCVLSMIRNYFIVFISGLVPLIKSYKNVNLPVCTTKECAGNFHLLLISEKTYNSFYNYLKDNPSEGLKMLSFWTELNVFKHSNKENGINRILATDIYNKYLHEGSDFYIDFPSNLLNNLNKSYLSTSNNLYNDVFDDLGEFVYSSLQAYDYPNFKKSQNYTILEKQLERDEIIYSRLVASSMISTLEIE